MEEPKNTDHTIQYYRDMIQYNLDICCYTGVIIYAHKILDINRREVDKMTYEELEEEREAQSSSYHEQEMLEHWEAEEEAKDITDYFQKDWKKYLESEEGKKYLEEINKNYNDYLNGKE